MNHETLIQRQLEREAEQVDRGAELYRQALAAKDAGDLRPGQTLVLRALVPMADAIRELVERTEAGKAGRGRPARALPYLRQLQPEQTAYLTARCCINAASSEAKLTKTAMTLASMIEDQYQFDELMLSSPGLGKHMERKARKWSTSHHRTTIMRMGVKVAEVKGLEWGQGDKLYLGLKLIELFIESTGLAEQVLLGTGRNKTDYALRLTPKTAEWMSRMHEKCELLEPRFKPMVCPPKPWTSPVSGGYLTQENRVDFIGGVSAAMRDDVFSVELGSVYRAINAIQSTAWRINRAVLDIAGTLWAAGETLGGLPPCDDTPVPARPDDIPNDVPRDDLPEEMRRRLDAWRFEAAAAHEFNATLISKRTATTSKLEMAREVCDEEAIFFPHNVDFRGRAYSLVSELSPQTDDLGKGLLEFAEGKPLGESGAYWLHVHIANLFGVDKVSFDERVAWVQEHREQLLDSAFNPLDGARFWTEADKPFCALAACFEFAGWTVQGDDYVSHLPIAMDGSCSGIQHFSAILKDADGGASVNLCPLEKPADLYTKVAQRVEQLLLESNEQLAISWRGKVKRIIVKRPCMTFCYSVTFSGIRNQIREECKKQAGGGQYLPGWDNFEVALFLAPLVLQAIRETVSRAAEAMDWLQASTKVLVKNGEFPMWFTPDGFPVAQRYVHTTGKRFEVWFHGSRLQIQLRHEPTGAARRPDSRKQAAAVAPNYVHSMDGCHLRMVVNRLLDAEITDSFAMIHDSFGVHACDVDALHVAIREEFIRLYSEDRLGQFREQVLAHLPVEQHADVPPCPEAGELDLEGILNADFFFA